jgi:hypothetical protein
MYSTLLEQCQQLFWHSRRDSNSHVIQLPFSSFVARGDTRVYLAPGAGNDPDYYWSTTSRVSINTYPALFWLSRTGLNCRPQSYQDCATTTELLDNIHSLEDTPLDSNQSNHSRWARLTVLHYGLGVSSKQCHYLEDTLYGVKPS